MVKINYHENSVYGNLSNEINEHLKLRFGYQRRCANWNNHNNTIVVMREKMDLYFRLPHDLDESYWPPETLVIARIFFKKQRAGHGKWLLELLVWLAPKYGYKNISLESAGNSESIQNFIRKFGFQRISYTEGRTACDWIIPVEDLEIQLLTQRGVFSA